MVSEFEIIIRVLVALILGLLIGLERQSRKTETKNIGAAGLRTHVLVSLGTGLITAVGIAIFPQDPARLAASIMAGIGFIGAGAIISSERKSMGLTSAASIWATAAIGICAGIGFFIAALFSTLMTLIVLQLRKFEDIE